MSSPAISACFGSLSASLVGVGKDCQRINASKHRDRRSKR
jgi:hypothetical protein